MVTRGHIWANLPKLVTKGHSQANLPKLVTWVANHKKFRGPPKVGRSPKLGDVSKGAACSKMATAKFGWVEEIDVR